MLLRQEEMAIRALSCHGRRRGRDDRSERSPTRTTAEMTVEMRPLPGQNGRHSRRSDRPHDRCVSGAGGILGRERDLETPSNEVDADENHGGRENAKSARTHRDENRFFTDSRGASDSHAILNGPALTYASAAPTSTSSSEKRHVPVATRAEDSCHGRSSPAGGTGDPDTTDGAADGKTPTSSLPAHLPSSGGGRGNPPGVAENTVANGKTAATESWKVEQAKGKSSG